MANQNAEEAGAEPLSRTPLYDRHIALGAKMVPFAGYEMPLQYPAGILAEHGQVRNQCGLFDVSHMGQIRLVPASGDVTDAAIALEALVPVDIAGLAPGRQRYGLFTNAAGGIQDDLMIANRGDHLLLVVNAACKHDDLALLQAGLPSTIAIEADFDRGLLALQGPRAEAVLADLAPEIAAMRFMDVQEIEIGGVACTASRSGYTGEDGFEISVPADHVSDVAAKLLDHVDCTPIGLGARDSLRLEAGMCLYGSDITQDTTPVEASLSWAIQKARRSGGVREGGFPGADVILPQLANGVSRQRVGLKPEGRAPIRGETHLFSEDAGGEAMGAVTSGGFSPTLGGPIAMGYVGSEFAELGTRIYAELRGRRVAVEVVRLPTVPTNYRK